MIQPSRACGFSENSTTRVAVELEVAEARGRPDGGHGREPAVRAVELEQRVEVDVGSAVAPGEHEGLVAEVAARGA